MQVWAGVRRAVERTCLLQCEHVSSTRCMRILMMGLGDSPPLFALGRQTLQPFTAFSQ